jgi:hypothetical protein
MDGNPDTSAASTDGGSRSSSVPNRGDDENGRDAPERRQSGGWGGGGNWLAQFEELTGYERANWGDLTKLSSNEVNMLENRVRMLVMTTRYLGAEPHVPSMAVSSPS